MTEYDELLAAHDRHIRERARLILDGVAPSALLTPVAPQPDQMGRPLSEPAMSPLISDGTTWTCLEHPKVFPNLMEAMTHMLQQHPDDPEESAVRCPNCGWHNTAGETPITPERAAKKFFDRGMQ